jgi:hypothetical protein
MVPPEEGSSLSARSEVHARSEVQLSEREEAYGPLTIRRYVKDDGRALELYSHGTPRETRGETTGERGETAGEAGA